MSKRRVVVTGIGAVSPFGVGVDTLWNNVKAGNSGISTIENMDLEGHTVHIAGEVKNFDPTEHGIDPKDAKKMDRFIHFAMVAATEAVEDSGVSTDNVDPYRFGVIVGSAAGGFRTIEKNHKAMIDRGPTKCSPFTIPMLICDMGAGRISIKYGAKGINKAIVTACATSAHSVGDAFRSIQWGEADVIIAGGAEATICNIGVGAFTSARTLSKRNDEPQKASRPYDQDRDGFVMAEGAGILVLEELEHAKARGAKIYAEVIGYGQTADAYDIVAPAPDGAGATKAMENAVKDAKIDPAEVKYVNAHGTSTGLGDIAESQAIANVFGDLDKNPELKVSSTKSMTGHMLGASGAIESIICIETINNGVVPPTINLDKQDERVANLNYVANKAQEAKVDVALSNSFGFGGHNASLVFKKFKN
ncbi:MAG: beta-ketoacyl-ACP synthase II [Candidatus Gastranaerophilales bacterium]|nr:beta-ketoacyl-ACP synthase II [Candidatus Gastranaerophilales bacterium]